MIALCKGRSDSLSGTAAGEATQAIAIFYYLLAACLITSALLFFLWSWHWPLVGDASAMHYLVFLMQRGWIPYRQLGDQQFPGAYLIEFAGMRIFGMSSLSWRVYDFVLLGIASFAFFAVTRSCRKQRDHISTGDRNIDWLPGLFSACLFILIHGRDGLEQSGQRDFVMAVMLLGATAFLFAAVRQNWLWLSAAFGLMSGLACSIKPTVLPLSFAQLAFACYICHRSRQRWLPHASFQSFHRGS
jgi:hypothetical protein